MGNRNRDKIVSKLLILVCNNKLFILKALFCHDLTKLENGSLIWRYNYNVNRYKDTYLPVKTSLRTNIKSYLELFPWKMA